MSVRKVLAGRKACGRLKKAAPPDPLLAPTQIRRLLDASASGLRDPVWGTIPGKLHLAGKLTSAELAAAKYWATLAANYSAACRSPKSPRTIAFDATTGSPLDPDSPLGEQEVERHERISAAWLAARNALRLAGRDAERVVGDVCEREQLPAGLDELNALRAGLRALSDLWAERRKARGA